MIFFSPGTINFESVKVGLDKQSLTYIDVRNKSELQKEGTIVGSFNVPCKNATQKQSHPL